MAQKIAVYSIPDLKNTTDDALPNYLNSLKFKQSHQFADVRLALGYSAVIIAAVTFAADYKFGWDATKVGTFWAVLAYFALNGAMTLWIWAVEKGVVYSGEHDGAALSIATSSAKHTPIYNVTVTYLNSSGDEEKKEISSPFTRWFDHDGFFVAKPFQLWLASEIPLIGQADPTNAGPAKVESAKEDEQAGPSDSTSASPRKRGRPRKDGGS